MLRGLWRSSRRMSAVADPSLKAASAAPPPPSAGQVHTEATNYPIPLPRDDVPLASKLFDPQTSTPFPARFQEHYKRTIAEDLLYLTYNHKDPTKVERLAQEPYVINKAPKNAQYKAAVRARYHDTNLRKPAAARTPDNIPALQSIVMHTFMKEALSNKYALLAALVQLELITGTTARVVHAKSNVAQWKIREGAPVGALVELEGDGMWLFLDKLVELVLPRLKTWYGVSAKAGDGTGNVSMGFDPKALTYFPEIEQTFDIYPTMCGLDLTFKTTAADDWEARALLSGLQIPIENAAAKAKREKYMQVSGPAADEPDWMKFKRAREAEGTKARGKK